MAFTLLFYVMLAFPPCLHELEVTPERTSPRQQKFAEKTDDELTKMLDMVPDENNNAVITDNK